MHAPVAVGSLVRLASSADGEALLVRSTSHNTAPPRRRTRFEGGSGSSRRRASVKREEGSG